MTKRKEETKFKPFGELKFDGKPVLFDADAKICYPFIDSRNNSRFYVAHLLEPIADELFLEREKAFATLSQDKTIEQESFRKAKPNHVLWERVCFDRIGYVQKENWKSRVPSEDKGDAVFNVTANFFLNTEADKTNDGLIDEDELLCLKFDAAFFGVPVDEWREWLTSGTVPENVLFEAFQYDTIKEYLQKGIAPRLNVTIKHFYAPFQDVSDTLKDEAWQLRNLGLAAVNRGSLASAARQNKKPLAESWLELFEALCRETEGYKPETRVPVWHKIASVQNYFEMLFDRLGK